MILSKFIGLFKNALPIFVAFALIPADAFSQLKKYRFEELDSLQKAEKRTVIVFIHTDWCKYCQTMKNTTFKNKDVIEQINNQFYFIDFNAEEKKDIAFKKAIYKYLPSGTNTGTHQLAEHLGTTGDSVSYPTLCFLNTDYEIIFQYSQFINSTEIKVALNLLK